MITAAQRNKFFPAMQEAWKKHCESFGGSPDNAEQMDAWYRDEMQKACSEAGVGFNIRSVKDLGHIAGFDVVMLHWAMIAQDDTAMAYFATAVERRCRKIIRDLLRTLSELENKSCTWKYAQAVCEHMNLPLRLEECPADMLHKVIQALDTHRRRILAARGELENRKPGLGSVRRKREQNKFLDAI